LPRLAGDSFVDNIVGVAVFVFRNKPMSFGGLRDIGRESGVDRGDLAGVDLGPRVGR
jgi:hypothetical protein